MPKVETVVQRKGDTGMRANYKVDFIWYYGYIIQDSKCVLHARIRTAEVV